MELHHPCATDEQPRPAHVALARLQATLATRAGRLTVVTEAVNGLHEQAELRDIAHGFGLRCRGCDHVMDHRADRGLRRGGSCRRCGEERFLWRHEPFWMGGRMSRGDGIGDLTRRGASVSASDLVVVIGGGVHDRAGHALLWAAEETGSPHLILSPDRSDEGRHGSIDDVVTAWVAEVLAGRVAPAVRADA